MKTLNLNTVAKYVVSGLIVAGVVMAMISEYTNGGSFVL